MQHSKQAKPESNEAGTHAVSVSRDGMIRDRHRAPSRPSTQVCQGTSGSQPMAGYTRLANLDLSLYSIYGRRSRIPSRSCRCYPYLPIPLFLREEPELLRAVAAGTSPFPLQTQIAEKAIATPKREAKKESGSRGIAHRAASHRAGTRLTLLAYSNRRRRRKNWSG